MLQINEFVELISNAIPTFQGKQLNREQLNCVKHDPSIPLMIVAGPGSGKTTVLVLRALRLMLVDGILPEEFIVTTFTRKASDEIRSRLIEWGTLLISYLRHKNQNGSILQGWLESIDVNRFVTGTLDSICEDVLTRLRDPQDPIPVVVEEFVANALLKFNGLFPVKAHRNTSLDEYLSNFTLNNRPPSNFAGKLKIVRMLIDRFIHDQVDLSAYKISTQNSHARNTIVNAAESYWNYLENANQLDFALLEKLFLRRLIKDRLSRFTDKVKILLVDEYQDTNPLQESIYFEILRKTRASFTIVGDDDQSLYRFRGATVELFSNFKKRFKKILPQLPDPKIEYLVNNYRSTPEIVDFFNKFIKTDPAFSNARVQPPKPLIRPQVPTNGVPILGLFRTNLNDLAVDLVQFLLDVFRKDGKIITVHDKKITIKADPKGGDFGDAVFLSHTVNEFTSSNRERLPYLLRRILSENGIGVFNPRGRALRDIQVVQQLLGTMLLCIDPPSANAPNGIFLADLIDRNALRREAINNILQWRQQASIFVESNPQPNSPHTLQDFIESWQQRKPQSAMQKWPDEWPLLELCFKILTWIPFLHDDPEGQVYLEAITRTIAQAATFSTYRSTLRFNDQVHEANSIKRAIADIFVPIAENEVGIDEEIMPSVPRDRLYFMTIHQAKGLEYPLVIVDVSSDFKGNYHNQRFLRFPDSPSNVTQMENDLAQYCTIGPLRTTRSALDRTFDDLVRLYYVAYSRAQSVLILVGLTKCLEYTTSIKHVATGWRRDEKWTWRKPVQGRTPSLANKIPLCLI